MIVSWKGKLPSGAIPVKRYLGRREKDPGPVEQTGFCLMTREAFCERRKVSIIYLRRAFNPDWIAAGRANHRSGGHLRWRRRRARV